MKKIFSVIIILSFFVFNNFAQENNVIEKILEAKKERLSPVIDNPDKYEFQLIYTQINRNENNEPEFKTYRYNVDPQKYFYPASTVKFPAAVLALEKLNELNIDGLTKHTPLKIDSNFTAQTAVSKDSTSKSGYPTIANYIKKIFLVSDNDAFNRIYEFLGQEYLNQKLHEKGYENLKLVHRLSVFLTPEQNRHTNAFTFFKNGDTLYHQPPQYNKKEYNFDLKNVVRGKGYYSDGKMINEPMDFSNKNYLALEELHDIMKAVMFPESVPQKARFNLTKDDYDFLRKYMSMHPSESDYPSYNGKDYYDSYVKFFMFGNSKAPIPENIRIFNKSGLAYGFLLDDAYIADFENGVEFILTAVMQTNENEIYNDNEYEYDKIGYPVMENLGKAFYEYELNREKEHKPDLSKFKFDY
jgi:beta-lactamase class A